MPPPFWKTKTLGEMSRAEWESLCDGCGRCCLHKLRDDDTGTITWTNVSCRLLDTQTCQCRDYENRRRRVPDCVQLTPESLADIDWLPPSCAYERLRLGQDLAWWHPLVSGDPQSVHHAGISVQGAPDRWTIIWRPGPAKCRAPAVDGHRPLHRAVHDRSVKAGPNRPSDIPGGCAVW
jgi:uncharacterized cysteine cluster protein YcgN (CxxCxxCC family)